MPENTVMPENGRRYASVRDAAEYLAVNPATIRSWIRSGRLPAYQFGVNATRVDLTELDALGDALR